MESNIDGLHQPLGLCRKTDEMDKIYTKLLVVPDQYHKQIWRIMRITTLLLIATMMQVSASTLAQKVTLSERNASLSKVFSKISKQTDYDFWVNGSLLKDTKPVTINVRDTELDEVLKTVFKDQPVTYSLEDKLVTVSLKKAPSFLDQITDRFKSIDITGRVIDENGQPIPGVTIKLKDERQVTSSDKNGYFRLTKVNEKAIIVISSIGYLTKELSAVANLGDIRLEISNSKLDEVQVIGYGITTKRLNTGNVSTISSSEIEKQPVTNVLSVLSGQMPGVFVQTSNGLPGGNVSIQIRGKASIAAGTDPLYIIDGVPFVSTSMVYNTVLGGGINGVISPLNSINPSDIDNISVLKDADATAIYGSRGANGVVLITTKKGKDGRIRTDIDLSHGISRSANLPKLLNLRDYLAIRKEAFKNDGLIPSNVTTSTAYAPDLAVWDTTKNTDWAKYILGGTAQVTNLRASLSGGDKNNSFNIGANYHSEGTVLPGDNHYHRGGTHMSVQHNSVDRRFSADMSLSYIQDKNVLVNPATALSTVVLLPPNFPIYDQNGNYNWVAGVNPAAALNNSSSTNTNNIVANALISYELLPGLRFKTSFGLNHLEMKQVIVNPRSAQNPANNPVSNTNFGDNSSQSLIVEPQVVYNLTYNRSSWNLLLGGTWQKTNRDGETIIASNFNSESMLENLASASTFTNSNFNIIYKYASVFGRLTYNYDDRYLINGSIRRDGSSRFGPGNQFGNFGAVGGAWIFSNEDFLKDKTGFLNFGKVRVSYGITGNDQISDYQYLSTYRASPYVYQGLTGLTPARVGNADFKWESNKKFNIGVDLGLFKDRILITADRFVNHSGNQLVSYALPYLTGFSSYQANFPADVENSGFEFSINTKNIDHKNFSWSSRFNITISRNILKYFPGLASSPYANAYVIGESILRAYGYQFSGADPQTGGPLYQLLSGGTAAVPAFDSFFFSMGKTDPTFYGGFGNAFSYGQFQLDVFAQFSKQQLLGGLVSPGTLSNNYEIALARWQNPGDLTNIPKAATRTSPYYSSSSANFFDASYIRLKNVSLSYNMPQRWLSWVNISGLRLYVQGENLATWWKKDKSALYDPESGANGNIPPLRTITMGMQLTL